MNIVEEHIKFFHKELPENITLVAVSKFHPIEALCSAYDVGQRIFGESRVQELSSKYEQMPSDVQWHFIGHLQTNKVRQLVSYVSLIHSVDSVRLLEAINVEATKINRTVDILLQLHVAQEATKFGFSCEECVQLVQTGAIKQLNNIRVCGVMGMATNTEDESEIRKEFRDIRKVFDYLKSNIFPDADYFKEVSMGMSDDYQIAIQEGSTMVRIGSTIFGTRNID